MSECILRGMWCVCSWFSALLSWLYSWAPCSRICMMTSLFRNCHIYVILAYIYFFYSAIAFTEAPQIKDWDEYRRMNTGLEQTFIFTLCINDFVTVNIFLNYLYLIYFLCPCLKNSGFFWATCIFVNVKVIKLVCIIMWWFIFFHYLFRKEAPKIYFIY